MRGLSDLPQASAVLFDLDGTLVDTVQTRIDAWVEALAEADMAVGPDVIAPLIGIDGKRLVREIGALVGRPVDDDRAETIDARSGEIYSRLNTAPRPLPGVGRLVAELERLDLPWAIATSSRKEQVTTSVAALELQRPPRIIDASGVKHAKPEPDLLLLAAREIDARPETCWYVGDATWDMAAAVAGAMIPVGVTAGSAVDAETLWGAGAATVAQTLDELADVFAARSR